MAGKTNQEIEEYFFERFRQIYPLPQGKVVYGDCPDVVIECEDKLGIELVRLYREEGSNPDSEQKQRELRESVVRRAQERYQIQGRSNYEVTFSFDKARPLKKNYRSSFERKLVDLVKSIELMNGGVISREAFNSIPELFQVYLNKKFFLDPVWRVVTVLDVPIMSQNRLQEVIDVKEEKVENYANCDAYWLLLIIDFIDPAQDQCLPRGGFDGIKSTAFEKIIVYQTIGEVIEVK